MAKQKIAILGGGVGAITAALELTSVTGWQDNYDITIYQLGWRLGGKGASGRKQSDCDRIQEHGLHIWMGFYENAFRMIKDAYAYCAQNNLMPGSPFQAYTDAFTPFDYIVLMEQYKGQWLTWGQAWPPAGDWPATDDPNPIGDAAGVIWKLTKALLGKLVGQTADTMNLKSQDIPDFRTRWVANTALQNAHAVLSGAFDRANSLPEDPTLISQADFDFIRNAADTVGGQSEDDWATMSTGALGFMRKPIVNMMSRGAKSMDPLFSLVASLRHLRIMLDVGLTVLRGIIADGIITKGFESVDNEEFSAWLVRHGCKHAGNALTQSFYDLCFAYPNGNPQTQNIAAGTMLHGMMRLMFSYRKSIMFAMNAGMGDTIFMPAYLALKDRGVKFEFFQKVTNLGLSADKTLVETIDIDVQAHPKAGAYTPYYVVKDVYCWPSDPFYNQLVEGDAIRNTAGNNDLESWWSAWPPVGHRTLQRGVDFDLVLNGISVGAIPYIAQELIAANPKWKTMVDSVQTVRTQAFQLWLHKTSAETGWNPGRPDPPVLAGWMEPFDTWADLSHLLVRESWLPADNVRSAAYFCNAAPDDPHESPFTDPTYPDTQTAFVKNNAATFLSQSMPDIWPQCVDGAGHFDRSLIQSEYYRNNIDPSERYVLSVAGSTAARLGSANTGFENLFLAGDWTRANLSAGCVESAVQSGMMASRGICGSPAFLYGAFGSKVPI